MAPGLHDLERLIEDGLGRALHTLSSTVSVLRRPYKLVVRLSLPDPDDEGDEPSDPAGDGEPAGFLDYLLQAVDDPSLIVTPTELDAWWRPIAFQSKSRVEIMPFVDRLERAARAFPPMRRSIRRIRARRLELTNDELQDFLAAGAAKLTKQGCIVQLPVELTAAGRRRLRARLYVGAPPDDATSWGMAESATAPFRWEVTIGDVVLAPEDFAALAQAKRGVVQVRGKFVVVDPREVAAMTKLLEKGASGHLPAAQAAGLALAGDIGIGGDETAEVVAVGNVAEALERARQVEPVRDMATPDGFEGELRAYQGRGLAWLVHLEAAGLGGVLADDMGLGKTAQVIALLVHAQNVARAAGAEPEGPTLVVCPASVLPNWERELRRFAPQLEVARHHGAKRGRDLDEVQGVLLTTYATLRSDQRLLAGVDWHRVVVDEAQNIKTHTAAQAKAARALPARSRLALTGTPVENRVEDLWSIMAFANPGLLGPRSSFRGTFVRPIERGEPGAAERLRRLTRPFVLRRTKSDPTIAGDLPAKVEARVTRSLTVEQATLYQAAVDQAIADIERLTGMRRRARVLTLLTELKQICDHPALYLKEAGPLPERSGKLARLTEMLEEAVADDAPALVFTQYAQMGHLLVPHLTEALGTGIPFLHGGLTLANRTELVDLFQDPAGPPVLIVSLRAGGVGINLTRAADVIHFDRWWNPAVEDQATDRAHRIGQTKTVFVHQLVVEGTLEDRIDEVIEAKRDVAGQVIGDGEAWLTELPLDDLREVVGLR